MPPVFDNTYAELPDRFYVRQSPVPVAEPEIVRVNRPLAERLGFDPDHLDSEAGAAIAVGNAMLEGSEPIATAYAGHQFGGFSPRLGDGRAVLLGEILDTDDQRRDLQLKGSGRTPWSRGGDGRSPLGPVLREYLLSEAMHALGIPTTRALAAARTGETVRRQAPEPGGVLMRVASSHIRIGTFEFFAGGGDAEGIRVLLEYVLKRHDPDLVDAEYPALELLRRVAGRQAALVAHWMLVGFVHGVMNTDNMLISGETIDYGPCAFIDAYEPGAVFSSIDRQGRYAFRNQPPIAQWNLTRLATALMPAVPEAERSHFVEGVQSVLDAFGEQFARAFSNGMAKKLGWSSFRDGDAALIDDLLQRMQHARADYTLTFRKLTDLATEASESAALGDLYTLPDTLEPWLERWRVRLTDDPMAPEARAEQMRTANPAFIPRNHLVQDALDASVRDGDDGPFHALVEVLAQPSQYRPLLAEFAAPPAPDRPRCVTFCGT